jgi:metal-dependent amidase/aminoacylase/carboxypeptidase family protein
MEFLDDARAQADDLVRLRRALHAEPEIGLELPRTQEKVLAGADPSTAAFNHSAQAVFDEAALPAGAALYAKLAADRLAAPARG